VIDALSAFLTRARRGCPLKGLISELVDGGLTHLQYDDDAIIFYRTQKDNLNNVRVILSCYDAMAGMKINFEKF
jgi:hypothetical protein